MDAVHQADEPIDIGVCNIHNRVFQCYCTQCYCLICPSCLMFDAHKGHTVCKIEEGARDIRNRINSSAREGLLKFDKTETILLDIRHAKLSLQENAQAVLQKSQKYFDELISTLKSRKTRFLEELREHFSTQIQNIDRSEEQWLNKQEISQKILKLQTSKDDLKLMEEAAFIVEGLETLSKPTNYREVKLLESVQSDLSLGKHKYQFKELQESLKTYLRKGREIVNRIKC